MVDYATQTQIREQGILAERRDAKLDAVIELLGTVSSKTDLEEFEKRVSNRIAVLNSRDINKNSEDIRLLRHEVALLRLQFDRRELRGDELERRIAELEKRIGESIPR